MPAALNQQINLPNHPLGIRLFSRHNRVLLMTEGAHFGRPALIRGFDGTRQRSKATGHTLSSHAVVEYDAKQQEWQEWGRRDDFKIPPSPFPFF